MAIYMKINGIDGNVTAEGHEKWIQIHSFNFGVGRGIASREPGRTVNREGTTVHISEISVSKEADETSPKIFTEATIGKAKDITIDFCRTGDKPEVYMQYVLSNALISSYNTQGNDNSIYENLGLNFDKITIAYTPYSDKNAAAGPVRAGYDLSTAKSV